MQYKCCDTWMGRKFGCYRGARQISDSQHARNTPCRVLDTYTYTFIHTCMHTYIPTYLHAYIYTCRHTQIYMCTHECTGMHTYIRTYMHTYMHIHKYMRIYKYTYTYISCVSCSRTQEELSVEHAQKLELFPPEPCKDPSPRCSALRLTPFSASHQDTARLQLHLIPADLREMLLCYSGT